MLVFQNFSKDFYQNYFCLSFRLKTNIGVTILNESFYCFCFMKFKISFNFSYEISIFPIADLACTDSNRKLICV